MYTINDIKAEYERLDGLMRADIAKTIPVSINTRCTARRGVYKVRIIQNVDILSEKIEISDFVMREPEKDFYNTIRHEYAHALTTRKYLKLLGHGKEWKEFATMVGANPEVASEGTEEQKAKIMEKRKIRWEIVCENCGHKFQYERKTKAVNGIEKGLIYTCPYCKSHNLKVNKL